MKKQSLVCLLVGWLLSGCALLEAALPQSVQPSEEVLATVNGVRLTRADLNKRMALAQIAAWLTTGGTLSDLSEETFVGKWIDSELLAQAAATAQYTATPGEAEQQIARLLSAAKLDETDLLRQLNLVGVTRDELVQYEQRAVAIQKFVEAEILAGASEVERSARLATWLVRERGTAKIEKPTPPAGAKLTGAYAGAIAPNFQLKDLDGTDQSLDAMRGHVVLVNFWATWCGPCRSEMPAIQKAYEVHKGEGLVVWGVNVGETPDQVRSYARELSLTFPLLLDGDSRISRQYRVFGLPTTVFVGRDGVIRDVAIGKMAPQSLDAYLKRILN